MVVVSIQYHKKGEKSSWFVGLESNQLKYVNRQLRRETLRLETQCNDTLTSKQPPIDGSNQPPPKWLLTAFVRNWLGSIRTIVIRFHSSNGASMYPTHISDNDHNKCTTVPPYNQDISVFNNICKANPHITVKCVLEQWTYRLSGPAYGGRWDQARNPDQFLMEGGRFTTKMCRICNGLVMDFASNLRLCPDQRAEDVETICGRVEQDHRYSRPWGFFNGEHINELKEYIRNCVLYGIPAGWRRPYKCTPVCCLPWCEGWPENAKVIEVGADGMPI